MDAKAFYDTTKSTLEQLAKLYGVKDLNRYFELTDYDDSCCWSKLQGIPRVFAQMAFHASNATMMSNIVRFKENYEFFRTILFDFQPQKVLQMYNLQDQNSEIEPLLKALRGTEASKGLSWNSNDNKSGKKDVLATRYAKTLRDCALYLSKYTSVDAFLSELKEQYKNKDYEKLIRFFMSHFNQGYSVALSCDFLKGFDNAFCNLPKPDVHIRDVLGAYNGKKYTSSEKDSFNCIRDFQTLVNEINDALALEEITAYKLDRMIWLICSEKFYLDGEKATIKTTYIERVKTAQR